ncbi:MAG TPA: ATP-binding protein [Pseudomonadota bacterium]|nr:response regulator [Rhodanobacteraceae bacterium]HQW80839.1 ATP-binding protein [Pseudomonadota bacterium]
MGCRWMVRLLQLLLLLLASGLIAAEPAPAHAELGLPFLRNYTPKEYGAHAQNWCVTQDARGVIYAGNNDGVLEFDGERWRLIHTEKRTVVRALAAAPDGRVYVGAVGEIGMLVADANGSLNYVSLLDRLPPADRVFDDVHHIFVRGNDVFFATYARLIRLRGNEVRSWIPDVAFHRAFMSRDRIFIRERGRGLMELVGDELQRVPGTEAMADERVDFVLPWHDTGLLIGSFDGALRVLDERQLRALDTAAAEPLRRDLMFSGVQLIDGGYAIGTFRGGVYFLDRDGQPRGHLDKPNGLQDDTVLGMMVDRQGGLWLSLDRGLSRVESEVPLTRFDERNGLAGAVLSLHRHRGQFYAGTTQGVSRLQPEQPARFLPVGGMHGQTYAFLTVGDDLLVGNNDGTYLVGDDTAVQVQQGVTGTTMALLASAVVPGRVYVGLWDGLAILRHADGHWIDEGRIAGVNLTVTSLFEEADGRLWIGTWNDGVVRLGFATDADGHVIVAQQQRFDETAGLPQLRDNYVQRVDGEALFSTHRGLMHFNSGTQRFEADPRFARLFGDTPRWVVYRAAGTTAAALWLQTVDENSGHKQAGLAQLTDGDATWSPQPLSAMAESWIETIYADVGGVIWFGGADGLFRFDSTKPTVPAPTTSTLVRKVSDSDLDTTLFGGAGPMPQLNLPFAANALRFEFAKPHYDSGDSMQYQTWLAGNDRTWSDWSSENFRAYTNLHERAYTLHLRSLDREGRISDTTNYAFRILPPWYRTIWAYLSYLLAGVLMFHILLRWRMAHARAENQALEAVVSDRTAELREKNLLLDAARLRAEAARQAADLSRSRAEDANRAKTVFLANMSHELRTPLNAVLGFAQLMDRQPQRSADDHRHLATILRSGEHLLDLINDVLSLSRIEAGVLALDVTRFDLRALIENVCELMRMRADARDLWLRIEVATLPKTVSGDARKLSQILLNLLGNAVKFTAHGGVTLRVRWHDGHAEFEVEDTGPGIAAHELGQLFAPFVQTEAGRAAKEGTGLGLALSRDMARLMGGDIVARSVPGCGATFILRVALAESSEGVVASERGDRRRVRSLVPGQTPRRILIVDDIDDNRTLLSGLLQAVGYDVRQATNGEEALTTWRDWRPHLIWLDKRMPGMDGTEVARRIRDEERRLGRERVAILALSASALEHQRAEILASGCDDFLSKPFREGMIFAKMADYLGVQYVYDLDDTATADLPALAAPDRERLSQLPASWLASMRRALAAGDLQSAMNGVTAIEAEHAELAVQLRALLAAYRLDDLDILLAAATPGAP